MAASLLSRDGVKCPLCLEYSPSPVSLDCWHHFCQSCIADWSKRWEDPDCPRACPVCNAPIQKENLCFAGHNRPQEGIADRFKFFARKSSKKNLMTKSKKNLDLFYNEDGQLVCVIGERTSKQSEKSVLLREQVAQEYKEKIRGCVKCLQKEIKILLDRKLGEEQKTQKWLKQLCPEKDKTKSAFEEIHKFLEEKEHFWLAQLEGLEGEIKKTWKENASSLSEDIAYLSQQSIEIEEKCQQQPGNELLQDVKSILSSYEKKQAGSLPDLSPDFEEKLRIYSQKTSAIEKILKKCAGSLEQELNKGISKHPLDKGAIKQAMNKVNVTLDPDTANPWLILSEDLKTVRMGSRNQMLPQNPERFMSMTCVLGREGFTSGRHWWEVEIEGDASMWALGVATEDAKRRGETKLSPSEGIWTVGRSLVETCSSCQLWAFVDPEPIPLTLKHETKKIRVSLDYERGLVEFFDADRNGSIFTFPPALFSRKRVHPYFWVESWGVRLKC